MSRKTTEYYTASDFIIGQKVFIYDRECLLYDCDAFTKEYYRDNLGIQQNQLKIDLESKDETVARTDPPYNGFGSEQDSLGNCYHLIPKPPCPDMHKLFKFDSVILRFIYKQITGNEIDKFARLILNFYMRDDSLSIQMTSPKNSGILGGKFLEQKKYKNFRKNGDFFTAGDFQMGSIIEINKNIIQILSADEFTLKFMFSHPELFPAFDLSRSLSS